MSIERPVIVASRGSALALAQANMVMAKCREKFPQFRFELKIIKTTGDKLQTASMSRIDANLPRGLFTKELEVALLNGEADLAVHSLKDLPTELPTGLKLGSVGGEREDVRDVLIYRDTAFMGSLKANEPPRRGFKARMSLAEFPSGTVVGTSSTRRKAQLLALRPDFKIIEIRGNVATRMEKLFNNAELDATVLAAAGLSRLKFQITADGKLEGEGIPRGLCAIVLPVEQMLPCVGQAAIGIEIRENDERIQRICEGVNHHDTFQCVLAERAFLRAMDGGCQSPVGAHAEIVGEEMRLRAVSFLSERVQHVEATRLIRDAEKLGEEIAAKLKGNHGS